MLNIKYVVIAWSKDWVYNPSIDYYTNKAQAIKDMKDMMSSTNIKLEGKPLLLKVICK